MAFQLPIAHYPVICAGKNPCVQCEDKCRRIQKLRWASGGQACFVKCKEDWAKANSESVIVPELTTDPTFTSGGSSSSGSVSGAVSGPYLIQVC